MVHTTIPEYEVIIKKFTDHDITKEQEQTALGKWMVSAAVDLSMTEYELAGVAQDLRALAAKIDANASAMPNEKVRPFLSHEVNGGSIGRLDGLLVKRQKEINQLKTLAFMMREEGEKTTR